MRQDVGVAHLTSAIPKESSKNGRGSLWFQFSAVTGLQVKTLKPLNRLNPINLKPRILSVSFFGVSEFGIAVF